MIRAQRWPEVAEALERIAPDMARAEFARRCNISESTISKGVKHGSKMHGLMATEVNSKLAELAAERAAARAGR